MPQSLDKILDALNIAAIITVLVIESSDPHFKQTVAQIERIQKLIKNRFKNSYTKEIETKFEFLLTKVKKGNLTQEEKLAPGIQEELAAEIKAFNNLNLENNLWVEGWKPDLIAFKYFNIMQMFRAKHNVRIS